MDHGLTCYEILDIADCVADRYALKKVNPLRFRKQYDKVIPIPLMVSNPNGCLWVDRDYVAYGLIGQPVQYAYVTYRHIREEIASYRVLVRCRENPARLPADIRAAFRTALRAMERTGKSFHIFEEIRAVVH